MTRTLPTPHPPHAPHALIVRSVAFWSDRVPDWACLRAVLRGDAVPLDAPAALPLTPLLSAGERRRAPDSVQLALHVARQVVEEAKVDASSLASVFASPHGDLGVTHAMCETLARDPAGTSPTRFIHSVHNAVSGHWGIAQHCVRSSTAIAAGRHTFAAGLLEAATQAACSGEPVLLVAYQTAPLGATAQLTGTEGRIAVALVLEPMTVAATAAFVDKGVSRAPLAVMCWRVVERVQLPVVQVEQAPSTLARVPAELARNHLHDALVWLEALARADATPAPVLALPLAAVPEGTAQRPAARAVLHLELGVEWGGRRT